MKLHNNKEAFISLVQLVSDYYRIDPALVEKDYFAIYEEAIKAIEIIIASGVFETE